MQAEWPLNLVLTKQSLFGYSQIFGFLLRVRLLVVIAAS